VIEAAWVEAALRRIGELEDENIVLAEAALLCAIDERPGVDLERCRQHLGDLVAELSRRDKLSRLDAEEPDLAARADMLRQVMATRFGYAGDETNYDDLRNADLAHVIDRRRGLPVALSILYIHAARALGWTVEGLNFPGHFLIRLMMGSKGAILDPFAGGIERSIPELRQQIKSRAGAEAELKPENFQALANRQILLRLQNNIKVRRIQEGDLKSAERTLSRMLWIAPEEADLWRESGILNMRLDSLLAARRALHRFLDLSHNEAQRQRVAKLLQEIGQQLH
jgi:regulator of sirC expression with transglutaminase-like and TPR domain